MNSVRRQLQSMMRVESSPKGFIATLRVDESLSVFADHFPDNPILPGFCLVQAVLIATAKYCQIADAQMTALKNAKLLSPIKPGDVITIDSRITHGEHIVVKATVIAADGRKCAEISLTATSEACLA